MHCYDIWQQKTTDSYLQQQAQIDAGDKLSSLLKSNTRSSQLTLIPKAYVEF